MSETKTIELDEIFKCSLFKQEVDFRSEKFQVSQKELIILGILQDESKTLQVEVKNVDYKCSWIKQENWTSVRPTIIMCAKDNLPLLKKTLENLKQFKITSQANVIVVDDRSTEDLKTVVLENKLSYLRVDNEKGFNFSMLNNIAAYIVKKIGGSQIVLWNSDLWCATNDSFNELLKRHRDNSSTISGTKLIYPPKHISMRKEDVNKTTAKEMHTWRETIQFGGSLWRPGPQFFMTLAPDHLHRFRNPLDSRVNCDKGEAFVTGALQVIDLMWFIKIGGLNPSLSKVFQDVDLCLRAVEDKKTVSYFGKNLFFYHDESVSMIKEGREDTQFASDHYTFGQIWNQKIVDLVE